MFSVTLDLMMIRDKKWKINMHIFYIVNTLSRVTVTNMATAYNFEVISDNTN
jgi:hypothetical protein